MTPLAISKSSSRRRQERMRRRSSSRNGALRRFLLIDTIANLISVSFILFLNSHFRRSLSNLFLHRLSLKTTQYTSTQRHNSRRIVHVSPRSPPCYLHLPTHFHPPIPSSHHHPLAIRGTAQLTHSHRAFSMRNLCRCEIGTPSTKTTSHYRTTRSTMG
jgi:hypothetical protein